jgi:hypothetical protein
MSWSLALFAPQQEGATAIVHAATVLLRAAAALLAAAAASAGSWRR